MTDDVPNDVDYCASCGRVHDDIRCPSFTTRSTFGIQNGTWVGVSRGRIVGGLGGHDQSEAQAREFLTSEEHPDVALWWFNQPISLFDAAERIPSVTAQVRFSISESARPAQ
jgi:hypothetical protein